MKQNNFMYLAIVLVIAIICSLASIAHGEENWCPAVKPTCNVKPHKATKKAVVVKKATPQVQQTVTAPVTQTVIVNPAPEAKKCEPKVIRKVIEKEVEVVKKNRVKLLGGIGPTSTSTSYQPNYLQVNQQYGAVVGIGYDRMIGNTFSIGAAVLTNKTGLLEVGIDF